MFFGIGRQAGSGAIRGAIEQIAGDGHKMGLMLGKGLNDVFEGLKKVPLLNVPPLVLKIMSEVPEYWDGLPKEQKQALFGALVVAGTRALAEYGNGGGAK